MKKLTKIVAVISMAALAFTTFSCSTNAKYTAEKNIQSLSPELAKAIKKDVKTEADAQLLLKTVISETMSAFMGSKFRATAKDAASAKAQWDAFYKAIKDANEASFNEDGEMIADQKINGSLDIAELGLEDALTVIIDTANEGKKKPKTVEDVKKLINKTKEGLFDKLDESMAIDRVYAKVDFLGKDKDGDKELDYIKTVDEIMVAASVKKINELMNFAYEIKDFPIYAIAVSEEAKGNVELNLPEDEVPELIETKLENDSQVALAAVTKEGLGAYITVKFSGKMDKETLQNILDIAFDDKSNTAEMISDLSPAVGKISFSFNNGKKETFKTEMSVADIAAMVLPTTPSKK